MLLSIIIPTRNRHQCLAALLERLEQCVAGRPWRDDVEIVCVDNQSTPETAQVVHAAAQRSGRVRYARQTQLQPSAEESMCSAVRHATGDYVWTLGDDDLPHAGALDVLVPLLRTRAHAFILLNLNIAVREKHLQYLRANCELVQYDSGQALFEDLGLVSATTTLSSLCFERAAFIAFDWPALQAEARIYSHSVGLLGIFFRRPCALLVRPLVDYALNAPGEELARFRTLTERSGLPTYFPFTVGLCRLVRHAVDAGLIGPDTFFGAEEVQFDKTYLQPDHMMLPAFVLKYVVLQLRENGGVPFSADDWRLLESVFRHHDAWNARLRFARWIARVRPLLPGWALKSALRKLERRIGRLQRDEFARRWGERSGTASAWLEWPEFAFARKPLRGMPAVLPAP